MIVDIDFQRLEFHPLFIERNLRTRPDTAGNSQLTIFFHSGSMVYLIFLVLVAALVYLKRLFAPIVPKKGNVKDLRVGIIGGGIAGVGAAWSLKQAGCNVTIFEKMPTLGGNAKTHTWASSPPLVSGLSVLAWPDKYFHNYNQASLHCFFRCADLFQLLTELHIPTTLVELKFFISDANNGIYAHDRRSLFRDSVAHDTARWLSMVSFVTKVNSFFFGASSAPSIYNMSVLNPLNIISLRTLSRLFRVSSTFWNSVVVPIYSSSFLTVRLNSVPAVILPVLHDLIPVDGAAHMRTWAENSSVVFQKLASGITVHTSSSVSSVSFTDTGKILVHADGNVFEFDRIIFACNSSAALKMMASPSVLEQQLLSGVGYADDDDISFLEGQIHSDSHVLPESYRQEILSNFANYIEVKKDGTVENTFVLSSWVPSARAARTTTPMLVTYNSGKEINGVRGTVSNALAHPHMSFTNTSIALLLRLVQGRRNVYYCGSFSTPGNGHDLSLLSGFVVAHALGAPYPFPDNEAARADFDRLRNLMGL